MKVWVFAPRIRVRDVLCPLQVGRREQPFHGRLSLLLMTCRIHLWLPCRFLAM